MTHPAVATPGPADLPVLHRAADSALADFRRAMDDDLNTSVALAALNALVHEVNVRLDALGELPISRAEQRAVLNAFQRLDSVFNLIALPDPALTDPELAAWVEARLQERQAARAARDFARADVIRAELDARGIRVEDTAHGPRWSLGS